MALSLSPAFYGVLLHVMELNCVLLLCSAETTGRYQLSKLFNNFVATVHDPAVAKYVQLTY